MPKSCRSWRISASTGRLSAPVDNHLLTVQCSLPTPSIMCHGPRAASASHALLSFNPLPVLEFIVIIFQGPFKQSLQAQNMTLLSLASCQDAPPRGTETITTWKLQMIRDKELHQTTKNNHSSAMTRLQITSITTSSFSRFTFNHKHVKLTRQYLQTLIDVAASQDIFEIKQINTTMIVALAATHQLGL